MPATVRSRTSSRPSCSRWSKTRTSRSTAGCSSSWGASTTWCPSGPEGVAEEPTVLVEVDGEAGIGTVTLNRPDALNSLTVPMKHELLAAFRRVEREAAVRAVILTGAGRAFCAGQDLRERLQPDAAPLAEEIRRRYNPIVQAMRDLPKPIVGAINGIAAGAGASLAFACDIRIASEGASFLLAFGRVALIPDSGATWFLPRLVGGAKAAELALTADAMTAGDAERFGLVARAV